MEYHDIIRAIHKSDSDIICVHCPSHMHWSFFPLFKRDCLTMTVIPLCGHAISIEEIVQSFRKFPEMFSDPFVILYDDHTRPLYGILEELHLYKEK